MHSHGLYFSSTILVHGLLVEWTSCIKFTLVTRPLPINYGLRPTDRTESNRPNPKTSENVRKHTKWCAPTNMFQTYTRAYVRNVHTIHTHILAQVNLIILCSIHWYHELFLSFYIYYEIQCYPIYVGYLTVLFFSSPFSSNFTLT